jgi:phosphoribosylformylglycinamidine cyclo-ligase
MVAIVSADEAEAVTQALEAADETVHRIGTIEARAMGCTVRGSTETWSAREPWSATHSG